MYKQNIEQQCAEGVLGWCHRHIHFVLSGMCVVQQQFAWCTTIIGTFTEIQPPPLPLSVFHIENNIKYNASLSHKIYFVYHLRDSLYLDIGVVFYIKYIYLLARDEFQIFNINIGSRQIVYNTITKVYVYRYNFVVQNDENNRKTQCFVSFQSFWLRIIGAVGQTLRFSIISLMMVFLYIHMTVVVPYYQIYASELPFRIFRNVDAAAMVHFERLHFIKW